MAAAMVRGPCHRSTVAKVKGPIMLLLLVASEGPGTVVQRSTAVPVACSAAAKMTGPFIAVLLLLLLK